VENGALNLAVCAPHLSFDVEYQPKSHFLWSSNRTKSLRLVIVLNILGIAFAITPKVDTDLCRVDAIDVYLWSPHLPAKLH
jgi:hypothetical protein